MEKVLLIPWCGLPIGGVQSVLMNIVRTLHNDFVFDAIVFADEEGFYEREFRSYGGKIFRLKQYSGDSRLRSRVDIYLRSWKMYKDVRRIISENGPYSAIHCNKDFESGVFVKASSAENVPIRIVHSHSVINDSGLFRTIYNAYYGNIIKKYATAKIACSDIAGRSLFGKEKFDVIANPYDDKKYFYSEDGDYSQTISLCQVGRICGIKNQIFSLKVVAKIKKEYPNVMIRFVGLEYDNYKEKMLSYIKENDLGNNVEFYPEDTNIPAIYKKTTYVIFPSITEGFGLVPVEAQAMGIKCFTSDKVPHGVDCGGCVYLPIDDAQSWADKIISDFKNSRKLRNHYDCSKFILEEVGKKYRQVYLGVSDTQ